MDGSTVFVVVAIVVAALVLLAVGLYLVRRQRSRQLQDRFGPEYERTIEGADSRREAEAELREREERREELDIRPLDAESRARYADQWMGIQQRFVDTPAESVTEADVLVMQVMRDRGYPVDDFDRRAADISVDHPDLVDHFRAAHDTAGRSRMEECDTEELREAVVHYRALFEALLDDRPDVDLTTEDRRDDGQVVDVTDQDHIRQF
jgi:hypothetical protein